MATAGERFRDRIFVESPDFCTRTCQKLAERLLLLPGEVDAGELDPETALEPLVNLINSCQKAVEAGGKSPVGASLALQDLNSINLQRQQEDGVRCAFETTASWHAEMYAAGKDPYDGYLLDDEDDDY